MMPSSFPGMDPFIESQMWEDFHHHFIEDIYNALAPHLRPRYVVLVEERVYIEYEPDERADVIRPDLTVTEHEGRGDPSEVTASTPTAVTVAPVVLTLPMPEHVRETFLTIRKRETMEVVTIIEVLSPGNKRPGSDGRQEYLDKRKAVLRSATHLIELDFLRGGERLPTVELLPLGDYYAFVCRGGRRPMVEVYAWSVHHRLPLVPVPLASDDPDIVLDLQTIFTTVYDRAGYNYSIDYHRPVEPQLSEADMAWVEQILDAGVGKDR